MTDLDLGVHYVRTPAGAKRYHRPIGSPIGTWPDVHISHPHTGAVKRAETQVKSVPATLKTGSAIRKGLKQLPPKQQQEAVRELRQAVRGQGSKKGLLTVSNQSLLRIAIDPKQHPRIRAEAKKELAKRVTDSAKVTALHRKAALEALRHGEQPNHFLAVDGPGLTEFQKALIKLNPRYGNSLVKVLQRLHKTETFRKLRHGRAKAKNATKDHLAETKHTFVHKAINMTAFSVGGALASHVMNGLGMDPTETLKHIAEWVKEASV